MLMYPFLFACVLTTAIPMFAFLCVDTLETVLSVTIT